MDKFKRIAVTEDGNPKGPVRESLKGDSVSFRSPGEVDEPSLLIVRNDETETTDIDLIYDLRKLMIYEFDYNVMMNGGRVKLNKNNRWDIVEDLESFCVSKKVETNSDYEITFYKVPVTGHDVSKHVKKPRMTRDVYVAKTEPNAKIIGRYPVNPPEQIKELFQDSHEVGKCSMKRTGGPYEHFVANARCRGPIGCFFKPMGKECLDVDFGSDLDLVAITVSARDFVTRRFPDLEWSEENEYRGPIYNVIDEPVGDLFFKGYRIYFRDAGGKWIPLGDFKGPTDNFSEKVHLIRDTDYGSDILCCRYLRFEVRDADKYNRGMKVSFFANGISKSDQSRTTRATVTYVLTKYSSSHNKSFSQKRSRDFDKDLRKNFKAKSKKEIRKDIDDRPTVAQSQKL